MVVIGNFRSASELQRSSRQGQPEGLACVRTWARPIECKIDYISDSGAALAMQNEDNIPDQLVLLLT
jgi:hypothetical protein